MPEAYGKERLKALSELRDDLRALHGDEFSQAAIAKIVFGVSRQTFNEWENGQRIPNERKRREEFIIYLKDRLRLSQQPAKFEQIWETLHKEWGWKKFSDEEWRIHFSDLSRPGRIQSDASDLPPKITGFIGRQEELILYRSYLETTGVAVVTGFPGVGKSWFAAKLAAEVSTPSHTFWHDCRLHEGIDKILRGLAESLAQRGNDGPLRQIELYAKSEEQRPLSSVIADSVFRQLSGQNFLICIDHFEYLRGDKEQYQRFVERLKRLVEHKQIRLIVTTQYDVNLGQNNTTMPLKGLSRQDAQQLLTACNVRLDETSFKELLLLTEGNAELLRLACDTLQQNPTPKQLLNRLRQSPSGKIKTFLLDEVHERLDKDERLIMEAVAILVGYPGTARAIEGVIGNPEEVLERQNLHDQLDHLGRRYLLKIIDNDQEDEYAEHEIVRAFYYDRLSENQRSNLHRRAGYYYEYKKPDSFKAALHYYRAGEIQKSAELMAPKVRDQLYQGRAPLLREIFAVATSLPMEDLLSARIKLAAGDIFAYLQEPKPAQENYAAAVTILKSLPMSTTIYESLISAYRGLGVLLRRRVPTEALTWLQEGLNVATAAGEQTAQADFWVQIGIIQTGLGNKDAAQEALERGLLLAPPAPHRVRMLALLNLGYYYYYQNQLVTSSDYLTKALVMAQDRQDSFNELGILTNLAAIKQTTGDWAGAKVLGDEAIHLAQQVGNQAEEIKARLNEAVLTLRQEGLEKGAEQLRATLESAQRAEFPDVIISAHSYLAEYHLRNADAPAALAALATAETLAKARERNFLLPFINYLYAECHLLQKDYVQARLYAEQAIAIAQPMGMGQEEGQGLRALGQVQMFTQQSTEADANFQKSLGLLSQNPYETARTQAVWGSSLLEFGDQIRGHELLEQAILEFQRLGTQHDRLETKNKLHK